MKHSVYVMTTTQTVLFFDIFQTVTLSSALMAHTRNHSSMITLIPVRYLLFVFNLSQSVITIFILKTSLPHKFHFQSPKTAAVTVILKFYLH